MSLDQIRFEGIAELAELLASYSISLGEAAHRQNAITCGLYFENIRLVGKTISETLAELDANVHTAPRRADVRERDAAGRADDARGRDQQQRPAVADGHRDRGERSASASGLQELGAL